jgi:cytidylate kinase
MSTPVSTTPRPAPTAGGVVQVATLAQPPKHPDHADSADHPRIIITIDGPAGTGKSSTSRALAQHLGLDFLDTGAMYRAAAALVLDAGIDPRDHHAVCELVARADLQFDWTRDPPELHARVLNSGPDAAGADQRQRFGSRLRAPDVTRLVSPLASIGELRRHMVRMQQAIGQQHSRLVTEGRDQGSIVFPDAPVKFFLDATPMVRAARRADQIREAGGQADELELVKEISARDASDSSRTDGPLVKPRDAIVVDTSALTFAQVVSTLETHVRRRLPNARFKALA